MDEQEKNLSLPAIILKLHQDHPGKFAIIYGVIALIVIGILVAAWQLWGAGPRRRRGLRAARKLLAAGTWQAALDQLQRVRRIGLPSQSWLKTFADFEAECLQAGADAHIKDKKFEEGIKLGQQAALILDQPEHEVRMNVQAAMVRETRRLFAKTGETDATMNMVVRTLQVQAPCREASFWQALCEIRLGLLEVALTHLQVSRTGEVRGYSAEDDQPGGREEEGAAGAPAPPSSFLDPPLYLGAILLRMGRAKDSLRFLTEANRMDPNCPFIRLQLGAAIVTAGGDTNLAVRALQFALGPKGLGQFADTPERAWVECFPQHRSYIRKLAEEFPFTCPLFGEDMKYLLRQGNLALAQGQFKLDNFKESADLFDKVLKEGAPSLPVLRGLGLSLARLGRYDDAFIHLRTAHEMEEEKDRITAGYLALCGAAGKPSRPEDKLDNIAWAIRLVTQFNAPKDEEWAGLLSRIFAEARRRHIPFSTDDQIYLCEHLASVQAADADAARAYHHLLSTAPELMHPEYGWLYCRADQQHGVGGDKVLALYARTFADAESARAYFAERQWDFDDVELSYLRRAAELAPGSFPAVLGADYLPRGEQLLLAHVQKLEDAGQRDQALQAIEVLVKLSPRNTSAMDRAAGLHFRAGRLDAAYDLLEQWRAAQPAEPLPLVRQAVLLHQQGHDESCFAKLQQALALAQGRRRANIAFLGARLALESYLAPEAADKVRHDALSAVKRFLDDCLAHEPTHPHARWCRAGVLWLQGDAATLAAQAQEMASADSADPRYHYLAALGQLLAGEREAVLAAADRAARHVGANGAVAQKHLAIEAGYLAALAHIGLKQHDRAIDKLKLLTYNPGSPTIRHARALLGNVLFLENRHDEAINAWQAVDAQKRQTWGLVEPLAQTTFISALESLYKADYEQAAEKLRHSGKLGYRDRRLGPLLLLALFKAGQQAIYAGETAPVNADKTTERDSEDAKKPAMAPD